jgi:NADPH:quinone reductase-like Zn-dependent oxidoreductase
MIIYPAVGMLVMAIEAANQLASTSRTLQGVKLTDTHFYTALTIPTTSEGIETQFSMSPLRSDSERETSSWNFRLQSCKDDQWLEHCSGKVQLDYSTAETDPDVTREKKQQLETVRARHALIRERPLFQKTGEEFYASAFESGYTFGPSFKAMDSIIYATPDGVPQATAVVHPFEWQAVDGHNHYQPHIVHPTTLDGILQISLAAFSRAGLDIVSTAVPTEIDYLWLSTSSLSYPQNNAVKTMGTFINKGLVGYETSVAALDEASSQVVLEAKGIRLRFVATKSPADNPIRQPSTIYTVEWKPDVDINERVVAECIPEIETLKQYSVLRRYLELLTFKAPSMKVVVLRMEGSDEAAVALQHMFSADDASLPCKDFVLESFAFEKDKDHNLKHKLVELAASDLVVLTGPPRSLAKTSFSDAYQLLAGEGKLIVVPDGLSDNEVNHCEVHNLMQSLTVAIENAGFTGVKLHADNAGLGLLTANKCPALLTPCAEANTFIIVHEDTYTQVELAGLLHEALGRSNIPSETRQLSSLQTAEGSEGSYIFLPEIERPLLQEQSSEQFTTLRDALSTAKGILWLSGRSEGAPQSPTVGMSDGLMRVLRAEIENAVIVTACLESGHTRELVAEILKIVQSTDFSCMNQVYESAYYKKDGQLHIGRVVISKHISQELALRSSPLTSKTQPLRTAPPLRLAVETPGLIDSLHFQEDYAAAEPLGPQEVEIKVSHIGLNFKDLLVALGRENGKTFGNECAGIVSRTGSSNFKPGERVCVFSPTAFSTYTRISEDSVARVPDNVSLAHAAAVPTQFVTAWHSLCNVAKLQKGESILIHSAAGGTGQVALQIAQMIGAVVFATVGTEEKRRFLTENYGVPAEQIYSSRTTSFAQSILRHTSGRGVDVVLNSLSGEGLLASWDIIAPYGRFIEIGKKDIMANTSLPMRPFVRRATFSAIETGVMSADYGSQGRDMIERLLGMLVQGELHMVKGLQVLPISKLQEGMRLLQSGKNIGKIVFEMTDDASVPVSVLLPRDRVVK